VVLSEVHILRYAKHCIASSSMINYVVMSGEFHLGNEWVLHPIFRNASAFEVIRAMFRIKYPTVIV